MFNINDYKSIIGKYFTRRPNPDQIDDNKDFRAFQDIFSIDIGEGFHSKEEKIKWISRFNSYRNTWAHAGTKEKGLNKQEVELLKMIHNHFYKEE